MPFPSQARGLDSSHEEVEVELFGVRGGEFMGGGGSSNSSSNRNKSGLGGHASSGGGSGATHASLNRSTALLENSLRTIAATEEVRNAQHTPEWLPSAEVS
jgi:hypothetical protein